MYPFKTNIKYFINVNFSYDCNFRCAECFLQPLDRRKRRTHRPKAIRDGLHWLAPSLLVLTGFGEPLLYPKVGAVCEALTEDHLIALISNLSLHRPLSHVLDRVDPKRISYVAASIHIEELERNQRDRVFLESVKKLKAHGIPLMGLFNVTRKFDRRKLAYWKKTFDDLGVTIFAKFTQATGYNLVVGTPEYDAAKAACLNMMFFHPYSIGLNTFPDIKCKAGEDVLHIDMPTGAITKCAAVTNKRMGDIHKGSFRPKIPRGCALGCFCHDYLWLPGFSNKSQHWPEFNRLVGPRVVFE